MDLGTVKGNELQRRKREMLPPDDCHGYLAVCTARDLCWKHLHWIVHKRSRALEQARPLAQWVLWSLSSCCASCVASDACLPALAPLCVFWAYYYTSSGLLPSSAQTGLPRGV